MQYVAPLTKDQTKDAMGDIDWLASATGFTANSMLTFSHRAEIARAVPEQCQGLYGPWYEIPKVQ